MLPARINRNSATSTFSFVKDRPHSATQPTSVPLFSIQRMDSRSSTSFASAPKTYISGIDSIIGLFQELSDGSCVSVRQTPELAPVHLRVIPGAVS